MESLIGKVEKTRVKGTKPASNSSIKEWLGHLSPFNVKKVESFTVTYPKKGEWERYDCDKDKYIICDVGIDCGSVSGGTVTISGHDCTG